MRILRIAPVLPRLDSGSGGIGVHIEELTAAQRALGHHVDVVHLGETDDDRIFRALPVHRVLGSPILQRGADLQFIRDYDMVHLHSHLFLANLQIARRLAGKVPIVVTNHGLDSQSVPRWLNGLHREIMGRALFRRAALVLSYHDSDALRVARMAPGVASRVIPNALGVKPPVRVRKDDHEAILVGRLVPGKRAAKAVRAFAFDVLRHDRLTIVGDGPQRRKLARLAGPNVRFTGEIAHNEAMELMGSAKTLILPSRHEGFPRVVLEALAAGCNVVASASLHQLRGFDPNIFFAAGGPKRWSEAISAALRQDTVGAQRRAPWISSWEEYARRFEREWNVLLPGRRF